MRQPILTLILVLSAFCWSLSAEAQEAETPAKKPEAEKKEDAEADTAPVTESDEIQITVTGERTERSLKNTASSVSVNTAADLELNPGIENVERALEGRPNITVLAGGEGPVIRGQSTSGVLIGAFSFLGGSRPRATVTIDGRPVSYSEFVYGSQELWDVDRVEVFSTPQTTTQGPNSIAGAIMVLTKDPTYELEAEARTLVGNYRTYGASGMVSGPLIKDELAGRIAIDYRTHQSFVDVTRVDFDRLGENPENEEHLDIRSKLMWEPKAIDGLKMKWTYARGRFSGPQGEFVQPHDIEDRKSALTSYPTWRVDTDSGIFDTTYKVNNDFSFSNLFTIGGYQEQRLTLPGQGVAEADTIEWTNESILRIHPENQPVSALVGAYYRYGRRDEYIDLAGFTLGYGEYDDVNTSMGFFGSVTWNFLENWELEAGIRYERDRQDRDGGFTGGAFVLPFVDYDETFDDILPKLVISHDVTKDIRVGALVQKAFNPGGTTVSFATGEIDEFDREYLWNFETFLRADFLNKKVSLRTNLFYTLMYDAQRTSITLVNAVQAVQLLNAEKAHTAGAEFFIDARPHRQVRVSAGLGLLSTRIDKFSDSVDGFEGNDFSGSPNVTGSLGVYWTPIDNFTFSAVGKYVSEYYSDGLESDRYAAGDGVTLDLRAAYKINRYEISAWCTNATDNFYEKYDFITGSQVSDPVEFGMEVKFKW